MLQAKQPYARSRVHAGRLPPPWPARPCQVSAAEASSSADDVQKNEAQKELQETLAKLQKLEKENAELKNAKVFNLGDLAGFDHHRLSEASSSSKRAKSASWEILTVASGMSKATSKQSSLQTAEDFGATDLAIFTELKEHIVSKWNPPKAPNGQYFQGMRPMTIEEVERDAGKWDHKYDLEQHFGWHDPSGECYIFYMNRSKMDSVVERSKYPKSWPRTKRHKVDPQVKDRKTAVLVQLTRLVKEHLGEFSEGVPGEEGIGAFLHKYMEQEVWAIANKPVNQPVDALTAEHRNGYLTKLLPPLTWKIVLDIIQGVWPHIQNAGWISHKMESESWTYLGELECLNSMMV